MVDVWRLFAATPLWTAPDSFPSHSVSPSHHRTNAANRSNKECSDVVWFGVLLCSIRDFGTDGPKTVYWPEMETKFERTACAAPGTGKACTVFKWLVVWWPLVVQMAGPSVFRAHLIQEKSLKNAHRRGSGFKPRQHKYFRPNFVKIKILNIGK